MPRSIKVGDKVQAFLAANIIGEVVNIFSANNNMWTSGGAPAKSVSVCEVRLSSTNELIRVNKSELFIIDY